MEPVIEVKTGTTSPEVDISHVPLDQRSAGGVTVASTYSRETGLLRITVTDDASPSVLVFEDVKPEEYFGLYHHPFANERRGVRR